ncbi:sensor histidine kinase [Micromonospora chaiyaphumensis]|uniref:histidine kinase n=1 Tax=Micromonospora chaiyaphumensis TaxID=307119 RepID=A0A1C4YYD1_9ACTN|nr:sensor histidine kinase [Micromonospora chaiyaphumensis]SCF25371.1 Signal transduction histidine kinase [Micromonospora chaiyaphumensis]
MDRERGNRGPWLLDGLVALALLVIGLAGTAPAGLNQGVGTGRATYPLVVVAAVAVAVRRRWPLPTLGVVTAASTAYLVLGYPYGPILLSFFVAVYTVAAYRPVRPAAGAAGVALLVLLTHVFVGAHPPGLVGLMPAAAWVVVPFAVGVTVRLGRENAARNRTDEARRLADAERLRVAREVHDVVGHGLAAIHLQAEVALHLLARKPEQAEAALTAISRTSKEALDELRVTLTVVRRDEAVDERTPAPGLAQLPQLRERLAGAGLPVTVEVDGPPRPLPVAVDLAAYRVVQEALTNVLRHAGPATATVRIRYTPTEVAVEVTDTGRGAVAAADRPGYGLAGMRERVTALGGSFAAGPASTGGFRVSATLPVEEVA